MNIVEQLRAFAYDATQAAAMVQPPVPDVIRTCWEHNAQMFSRAADHIETQDKRYAEGLAAWRENNLHHQARIAELEKQINELCDRQPL